MVAETRPLAEVTQEALSLLYKEIGVVDTIRFINQFSAGYGNYTEERATIFADQRLDDLVAAIKNARANDTV